MMNFDKEHVKVQNKHKKHKTNVTIVNDKKIHKNIKYAKITNKKEIHYDLQYSTGLIKDNVPFNPEGSCVGGGIYFAPLDKIHKFLNYGCWLRIVSLPINDPNFQMTNDGIDKFRANMIILSERYSLFDIETYKKFGLAIPNEIDMVMMASNYGEREILEKIITDKNKSSYESISMNAAAINGHIQILNFWFNLNGIDQIGFCNCVKFASMNGQIEVLKWCLRRGFCFRSFSEAITFTAKWDQINTLNWLLECVYMKQYLNSGSIQYNVKDCFKTLTIFMSKQSNINILNRLINYDLVFKYLDNGDYLNIIACVIINNNIEMLDWWLQHKIIFSIFSNKLNFSEKVFWSNAIDTTSSQGHSKILQLLLKSGLRMYYSDVALNDAYKNGHKDVIIFWLTSDLGIKCSDSIMEKLKVDYYELFMN